jgi:hypothetical protein
MSGLSTFQKTELGWAATMPPEMAEQAGVQEDSLLVVYFKDGAIFNGDSAANH